MGVYEKEVDLLLPVESYIRKSGFQLVEYEVKLDTRRIDIFAVSGDYGCAIAVELKLRDWKKAAFQASLYQLCADYVYIAMPDTSESIIDFSVLTTRGIGLLLAGQTEVNEVLPASKSIYTRFGYRDACIRALLNSQRNFF